MDTNQLFAEERIPAVLFKLAPPVMFAQLIQALYNIVDSLAGYLFYRQFLSHDYVKSRT